MTLCLIVHDLPEGGAEALEAAVWEVSESHCMLAGAMLVDTGVSAAYLLSHLNRGLRREGLEGRLLVTEIRDAVHMAGLEPEIVEWVRAAVSETAEQASG